MYTNLTSDAITNMSSVLRILGMLPSFIKVFLMESFTSLFTHASKKWTFYFPIKTRIGVATSKAIENWQSFTDVNAYAYLIDQIK